MSTKVTVFSTGGKTGIDINTEATTWKQLKQELSKVGVSTSGMKAVVGQSKVSLEHEDAQIPQQDFTLFMLPVQTKSGYSIPDAATIEAMPYGMLRNLLKDIAAADGDAFKDFFNQGKNYTTKSTQELKDLLVAYGKNGSKAQAPAKTSGKEESKPAKKAVAKPGKNVGDIVKDIAASKSKEAISSASVTRVEKKPVSNLEGAKEVVRNHHGSQSLKDAALRALDALEKGKEKTLYDQAKEIASGMEGLKSF
jgi:hypothetical protein